MPSQVHLTAPACLDLLIVGGHVIDPANGTDSVMDVAIVGGKIVAVGKGLARDGAAEVYDASGMIVTPGLVDTHVHCMAGLAPYGMEPDEWCLGRGCTTVVDAGTAGANSLAGMKKHVAHACTTRVLAFCHAAVHGLVSADAYGYGPPGAFEMHDLVMLNVPKACHAIRTDLQSSDPFCVGGE